MPEVILPTSTFSVGVWVNLCSVKLLHIMSYLRCVKHIGVAVFRSGFVFFVFSAYSRSSIEDFVSLFACENKRVANGEVGRGISISLVCTFEGSQDDPDWVFGTAVPHLQVWAEFRDSYFYINQRTNSARSPMTPATFSASFNLWELYQGFVIYFRLKKR